MSLFRRLRFWNTKDSVTTSSLNEEFENVVKTWNDHNNGVLTWDASIFKGTTGATNAAAGVVGEYIESVIGSTSAGTSGQYTDSTSIDLTPGDWEVNAMLHFYRNSATFTSMEIELGISVNAGNTASGLVSGSNYQFSDFGTTQNNHDLNVNGYRMSLASNTTVYLKTYVAAYTVGTPKLTGRLSARRVR